MFSLVKIFTCVAHKFNYSHAFSHIVFKQFLKKWVLLLLSFTPSCEISSSEGFFGFLPVIFLRQEVLFFFFLLQTSSMGEGTRMFCFPEKEKISLHLMPLDWGFPNLWVLGSVPRLNHQGPCQTLSSPWELKEEAYSKCLWPSSRVTRQPVLTA